MTEIFTVTKERRDLPWGKVKKTINMTLWHYQCQTLTHCRGRSSISLGERDGGNTTPMGVPRTPKYLDQFLMVLLTTFTTGLVFARQSKQRVATLRFDHNYT